MQFNWRSAKMVPSSRNTCNNQSITSTGTSWALGIKQSQWRLNEQKEEKQERRELVTIAMCYCQCWHFWQANSMGPFPRMTIKMTIEMIKMSIEMSSNSIKIDRTQSKYRNSHQNGRRTIEIDQNRQNDWNHQISKAHTKLLLTVFLAIMPVRYWTFQELFIGCAGHAVLKTYQRILGDLDIIITTGL